jgi:hypothetical protein
MPWLLLVAAAAVALVAASVWRRRAPARRLDDLFWTVTLRPLLLLPEAERERRLAALAATPLCHPGHGLERHDLTALRRRMLRLGRRPLADLVGPDLMAHRATLGRSAAAAALGKSAGA